MYTTDVPAAGTIWRVWLATFPQGQNPSRYRTGIEQRDGPTQKVRKQLVAVWRATYFRLNRTRVSEK